ncbi:hypothetical protein HPB50_000898 [Hyalomma asiaticum]|uniref:Uncharacterized protein n=1 Tax=Hyalomma asiaticum TaxID=266040 RepID=A0ACB7SDP4_HYAAI|nr:hypothetical protein HPB50_000898 [Hyalomma asiaticum]
MQRRHGQAHSFGGGCRRMTRGRDFLRSGGRGAIGGLSNVAAGAWGPAPAFSTVRRRSRQPSGGKRLSAAGDALSAAAGEHYPAGIAGCDAGLLQIRS